MLLTRKTLERPLTHYCSKIVALPYLTHLLDPLAVLLEALSGSNDMNEASKNLWSRTLDLLRLAMSLDFEGEPVMFASK